MSFTLLLLRVPPGASEDEVETIALSTTEAEETRAAGPLDPTKERRKRALVDALLAECPELEGGEPDYAALARAEHITEEEARHRFHWWTVAVPAEGSGIEITLYDDYVSVDIPSAAGTGEDWEDVGRYLEILVREGGFVVWDPQGPNLVDLATEASGEAYEERQPASATPSTRNTPGRRRRANVHARTPEADGDDEGGDVEPEDLRRGGEIGRLINRIVDEAIARPLAAAGFERSGRTWRRVLDSGLVHVVNVQWSPRQRGVEGMFSLNAGAYSRALAESVGLYPPTDAPKEYDCHVRLRPGAHGRSYWRVRVPGIAEPDPDVTGFLARAFAWLDRRADAKAADQHVTVARELREALETWALPAFERMRTLRGVRDELARGPDLFWAAHASLLLGERDEAKRLVDDALRQAKRNPEFSDTVREWARRQGLS
jgi:hypothetical protein